jgi:tripartite-type tricarboxylate transporter receptor subunit TctC
MVVSFPPGGPIDLQTRILARYLEKEIGVPVVVENKPGGGGALGAGVVVNSPADGYTLSTMTEISVIMPVLLKQAAFSIEDLRPVCQLVAPPAVVFVVRPDSPWKTFGDFVAYARKNPGVKIGHPPVTTTAYLKMRYVNKTANLGMVGVPFKTDPEINVAVLGKHVPIAASGVAALGGLVEAGKLRVLFSFNPASEIPTLKLDPATPDFESFFHKKPNFEMTVYVWINAKTSNEIVQVLKKTMEKVLNNPEVDDQMKKIGYRARYGDGDVFMKSGLPESIAFIKETMTEVGLMK